MSTLRANIVVAPQEIYTDSSTQGSDLGAVATTGDGRYFRYVKVGALALVSGKLYQGPASDITNLSPSGGLAIGQANATGSFGPFTISDSTTVAANALAGAIMSVAVTPGQGEAYRVKSNGAAAGATGLSIVLDDPLVTNLSTASRVVFYPNMYNGVIIADVVATGALAGVAVYPVAATHFGWLQTRGLASALIGGTPGPGVDVGYNLANTTGALSPATGINFSRVGNMSATGVSGEYDIVNLALE